MGLYYAIDHMLMEVVRHETAHGKLSDALRAALAEVEREFLEEAFFSLTDEEQAFCNYGELQ